MEKENNYNLLVTTGKEDFFGRLGKTENFFLFINALSAIFFGINGFHMKYAKIVINQYDMNSFILWRSVSTLLISYLIIHKNKINIIHVQKVKNRFWLFVRTFGQMIFLISYIFSLKYLRVGTTSTILSLNPLVLVILSTLILKEKFYIRYLVGIIICFLASLLIISSDRQSSSENKIEISNTLLGVFWAFITLLTVAMISVSSKILSGENISWHVQCFYLGLSHVLLCLFYSLIYAKLSISFEIILHGLFNGFLFIVGTICLIESIKKIDLNKTTSLSYINCITVFFLGFIFLGEKIYFLDFVGCTIIIGYNILNSIYPVKES